MGNDIEIIRMSVFFIKVMRIVIVLLFIGFLISPKFGNPSHLEFCTTRTDTGQKMTMIIRPNPLIVPPGLVFSFFVSSYALKDLRRMIKEGIEKGEKRLLAIKDI